MANEEHVARLRQGVNVWNAWREKEPSIRPDLSEADLYEADLSTANLSMAYLREANLSVTFLNETILGYVDLSETKGLDQCVHLGPSIIDHRTLQGSGP